MRFLQNYAILTTKEESHHDKTNQTSRQPIQIGGGGFFADIWNGTYQAVTVMAAGAVVGAKVGAATCTPVGVVAGAVTGAVVGVIWDYTMK